jgi:hypothetical protein
MRFAARRSKRNTHIVVAMLSAFTVFGVLMIFFTPKGFGISMILISVLILLLIIMEMSKIGWYYQIDERGIVVKRTFKRYRISDEKIDSVKTVGWSQAEKILRQARQGATRMGTQVAFGRTIGFSSIALPVPDSKAVPGRKLRPAKSGGEELFISLKRKDGRYYLLTPVDAKGFEKAYKRRAEKR